MVELELLSSRLHDIYQKEMERRGTRKYSDSYDSLDEPTKELDRVLARWILRYWQPMFDGELPPP